MNKPLSVQSTSPLEQLPSFSMRERLVIVLGVAVLLASAENSAEACTTMFEQARKEGRYQEETWQQAKGGRRFLASVAVTPLLTESGALRGYSVVMCDVTARKQAERQLVDTNR